MQPAESLRSLMEGLIDYAGLFPPAQLPMARAVQHYADYLRSGERWALGRFVVPAARLDDFAAALEQVRPAGDAWRLSTLLSDIGSDLERLATFVARPWRAGQNAPICDTVEFKATTPAAIEAALDSIPRGITAYVELPLGSPGEFDVLLDTLAGRGGRAKVRTGGITAAQFPEPAALLAFIASYVRAGVPFKATAGLHHPLRGRYRLTYEPDSALCTMFGFLNVFLAAAGLHAGMSEAQALKLLTESDARSLRWDHDAVAWRGERVDTPTLAAVRQGAAIAFGSCSFEEPIADLRALGLLAGC
jgi:hypothetical protein